MSKCRAAIDTITGYYYQFDYFILKLLEQQNDSDAVCIEGIEDVDLETANLTGKKNFLRALTHLPIEFKPPPGTIQCKCG